MITSTRSELPLVQIPATVAALLDAAEHGDRIRRRVEARGHPWPTLEREAVEIEACHRAWLASLGIIRVS